MRKEERERLKKRIKNEVIDELIVKFEGEFLKNELYWFEGVPQDNVLEILRNAKEE